MNNFIITTDTTSDLPAAYVEQHQIGMLSLTYTINDTTYSWEHPLPVKEFYDCMRQGSLPTTSQANPEEAAAVFEKIINEQNADILHIAFSSGLSGSYNSARLAAGELSEKYPDRKIIVIDSLCASLGEGLLVHKAVTLKEQGHTLEETADWLESNKLHLVHNFTVNDLFHLYRGGRVSKTAAAFGTALNIVPIMHLDYEGHLEVWQKVRGDKQCFKKVLKDIQELVEDAGNQTLIVSEADAPEKAREYGTALVETCGFRDVFYTHIGPIIGAHTGPGLISIFFVGKERV
mgnify:CR=1 FL=1